MYHDLASDGGSDIYTMKPLRFSQQLHSLVEWLDELSIELVSIGTSPTPGVAVSFDDGYSSTLRIAAPLLTELNIPFHVYVTKDLITGNDDRYMRESMLKELATNPLASIGCHGVTHRPLGQLSFDECLQELRDSRSWLENLLQQPVREMSYPNGSKNSNVIGAVSQAGYELACCSDIGTYIHVDQSLEIPRVDIWALDSPQVVQHKIAGAWEWIMP
jgi:peptidoglycan/xylan/chitin deacetylase (PgdA/CDA1 family)